MTSDACAYLIDTNVLIYSYDRADPFKQTRAIEVLETARHRSALTVQVLGEFYVNVTRKPLEPLPPDMARQSVFHFARSWRVLDLTSLMVREALRGAERHKLSYWDSLLWGSAMVADVPFILTEDQQDRRLVEDVRYINPFLPDFDPASLSY